MTRALSTPDSAHAGHSKVCEHVAHIYSDDNALCKAVVEYTTRAIERGEAVVWLATEAHLKEFASKLNEAGHQSEQLRQTGQLVCVEAVKCVRALMKGRSPSRPIFDSIVSELIDFGLRHFNGVAAYGELVNVLAEQSNPDAAAQLERWWNHAIRKFGVRLLCGYRLNVFDDRHQPLLESICESHTEVTPTFDSERLEWAVDEALRVTFMDADVAALRQVLLERFAYPCEVPQGLAAIMALNEILPSVAHDVRMLARDYYGGYTPLA